jgi:hypothetical protein
MAMMMMTLVRWFYRRSIMAQGLSMEVLAQVTVLCADDW